MKLSIVVPVYNVADYLPRCLDSLLGQDLTDCELLLIDDGSTDGKSGALCDEYARKHPDTVRVIHQENRGLGGARNTGIEAARGEYLLFVDSDDYVLPRLLETLDSYMERGADVLIFGFLIEDGRKRSTAPLEALPVGKTISLEQCPQLLLSPPSAWNKLWRRALFLDSGIRFPARLWYEDLATTGRLFTAARQITAIRDELYVYVLREGSITRNRNIGRNLEIMEAVSILTDRFRDEGLYQRYETELEALAVRNMLLDASVRVLKTDGDRWEQRKALEELRVFTDSAFPRWPRSPYNRELSRRHRLILCLLRLRCYGLIRSIFRTTALIRKVAKR